MQQNKINIKLVPLQNQFLHITTNHIKLGVFSLGGNALPNEFISFVDVFNHAELLPSEYALSYNFGQSNSFVPVTAAKLFHSDMWQQPRKYNLSHGSLDEVPNPEFTIGGRVAQYYVLILEKN